MPIPLTIGPRSQFAQSLPHLRRMFAYGFADVLNGATRFALALIYAQHLSPGVFGELAIVYTTVVFANMITLFGLPDVMMSHFHLKSDGAVKQLMGEVFWFSTALSAVSCILASAILRSSFDIRIADVCLFFWIATSGLQAIPSSLLRYNQQAGRISLLKISSSLFLFLLSFLLISTNRVSFGNIILVETAASVLFFLLLMIQARFLPQFSRMVQLPGLLALSLPIFLLSIAEATVGFADRYIISSVIGSEATGYYGFAARLALLGSFAAEAFNSMWSALYFRKAHQSPIAIFQHTPTFLYCSALFFVLLAIAIVGFSNLRLGDVGIINDSYRLSLVLVPPLVFQFFFKQVYFFFSAILIFSKRNWHLFGAVLAAVILNLTANVLILKFGPDQLSDKLAMVALTSMLSYFVTMMLSMILSSRILNEFRSQTPHLLMASTIPMLLIVAYHFLGPR